MDWMDLFILWTNPWTWCSTLLYWMFLSKALRLNPFLLCSVPWMGSNEYTTVFLAQGSQICFTGCVYSSLSIQNSHAPDCAWQLVCHCVEKEWSFSGFLQHVGSPYICILCCNVLTTWSWGACSGMCFICQFLW